MDNIQKLILGVLSVAGMLAMLVPSGDAVAPAATDAPPAAAAVVEPVPAATELTPEE